jgi:hypothetical protein
MQNKSDYLVLRMLGFTLAMALIIDVIALWLMRDNFAW